MGFFARPRLSNDQFVQHNDDVLTLTGQTRIATTTGLTLIDTVSSCNVIITASGATNFDVLTYCDGVISLQPSSASGGTGIYDGASPSTCSVGGLPVGTNIYGSGYTTLFQCILAPTLNPTLTNPSISSLTLLPASPQIYEIGSTVALSATTYFNPGSISPQYCSASDCRSSGTTCYSYDVFAQACSCEVAGNYPSNTVFFGVCRIGYLGANNVEVTVCYSGGVQPKNSSGGDYDSPLVASATTTCTNGLPAQKTLTGVYPWFWGTSATAPDVSTSGCTQCLINSYTPVCGKVVASSTGTINVPNFGVTGKYLWFATPYASCSKSCWQGANNVSNNGIIPGGLFPAPTSWNIGSPENCWGTPTSPVGFETPICYKIYVSNYATNINYGMTFCN